MIYVALHQLLSSVRNTVKAKALRNVPSINYALKVYPLIHTVIFFHDLFPMIYCRNLEDLWISIPLSDLSSPRTEPVRVFSQRFGS